MCREAALSIPKGHCVPALKMLGCYGDRMRGHLASWQFGYTDRAGASFTACGLFSATNYGLFPRKSPTLYFEEWSVAESCAVVKQSAKAHSPQEAETIANSVGCICVNGFPLPKPNQCLQSKTDCSLQIVMDFVY